jgi:coenzyme F420-0:L-glutamate ligase / coenzyme F420-1:gamma-L-glutamate ligase
MSASLTLTALDGVPTIGADHDLLAVIAAAVKRSDIQLRDNDILVLAQKIVSKAEGRAVRLSMVTPSRRARDLAKQSEKDARVVELILQESTEVLRCRPGVLIVVHRLGFVIANAGIDASNVEGGERRETVLLLPTNPDASAASLKTRIRESLGVDVGVVINDSFGRAWRLGTIGTAIGVAGMPALLDLRGAPDRTGRPLRVTEVGIADEAAAAASLLMGQAAEGRPIVHIRGFPYAGDTGTAAELIRPKQLDMFR